MVRRALTVHGTAPALCGGAWIHGTAPALCGGAWIRRLLAVVVVWVVAQGGIMTHRARAQPAKAQESSHVARRKIAATLDALEKVLLAVHGAHCRIPQDVEIRLSNHAWIVALEWEQPAKSSEWSLQIDSGRVVHGPCVGAPTQERLVSLLAFVRAVRAAIGKAPRYQSAPERFQVAVARLPGAAAWQVDFFTGEDAPGDGEMVLVDDKSFRVLESKLTP